MPAFDNEASLKLLDEFIQYVEGGHTGRYFWKDHPQEKKRFLLMAAIAIALDGDEVEVSGDPTESSCYYAKPLGVTEVITAVPGGTARPSGPFGFDKSDEMRFTPLLEEEERTGDESWRNELDEDEEGALFVLENGGDVGEYYYNNDGSLVDEDQFYENMRGAADSRGVDWYWRDMDCEELKGWIKEMGAEKAKPKDLARTAAAIRGMLTRS